MFKNRLFNAILTGLIPAVLEGLLIYFTASETNVWILIQSVLFWFSCGFVISLIEIGKSKILTSVLLTLLLNIPWFIALTIVANHPEHFIPLIISSLIMGIIIGLSSLWLHKKTTV
jgi:hypothetical protein